MNYKQMKQNYIKGWHTWNVRSILSHVHMPDGFALNIAFKEYSNGHYLKETLIGRFAETNSKTPVETVYPGIHAFDESYTEITLEWCNMKIKIESAIEDDNLILLITPVTKQIKPAMLVLEGGFLWGYSGWVEQCNQTLIFHRNTKDITVYTTGQPMTDPNIPVQTAFLSVKLDEPVAFSTRIRLNLQDAQKLIYKHRLAHSEKTKQYGILQTMYEAMECALAWDTVYDAKNNRVISPVSRLWSINNGGYVLFCWDNFFAGFMASLGNTQLAYSNLREILNEQTQEGFVPNFAYATGQVSSDRSQPPVGSAMLLETYRISNEKWIIKDMYDDLLKWNSWFFSHRMNSNGTLSWGSEKIPVLYGNRWETEGVHDTFGASLESGMDNSPMYDNIPFNNITNRLELEDVGLTGLFILDCRCLIELSKVINRQENIPELQNRMKKACNGLENLWDEKNGFYYNRRTDTGEFSRRISPTNFYALFSPNVSTERQRRIADEHYYNPDEFYGKWMLPSIAHNDTAYSDQDYWRGRIWAPLNFLVYLSLVQTQLDDVRHNLAEKSISLFMKEWTQYCHIHENYNGITGEGCDSDNSDKFYHWGALLCIIALADAGYIKDFGKPLEKNITTD